MRRKACFSGVEVDFWFGRSVHRSTTRAQPSSARRAGLPLAMKRPTAQEAKKRINSKVGACLAVIGLLRCSFSFCAPKRHWVYENRYDGILTTDCLLVASYIRPCEGQACCYHTSNVPIPHISPMKKLLMQRSYKLVEGVNSVSSTCVQPCTNHYSGWARPRLHSKATFSILRNSSIYLQQYDVFISILLINH